MGNGFAHKSTDQLSDLYGEWLEANGFEGDEPADDLLRAATLSPAQREWLESFCAAYKAREEYEDAALKAWPDPAFRKCNIICDKWVAKIGLGFHPDTSAEDYVPTLSREEIEEYATDIRYLFAQPCDPYAIAVSAMERAGLC
jgi:hypothetical protein